MRSGGGGVALSTGDEAPAPTSSAWASAISAAAAPSTTVTKGGASPEVQSGQSHAAQSKAAAQQRSAARKRESCGRQKSSSLRRMPCQSSDSVQPPSSRKAAELSRATAAEASAPSPRAASVARAVA